jgi:hypothetical protein
MSNRPGKTSNGTVYDIATTGSVPGLGDVAGDPRFVDPTRNIQRWAQECQGADGTIAGALAALKENPEQKIEEMIEWVRAGFAPRNRAYKNAAHDGGDIGAVPAVVHGVTAFTGSLYSHRTVVY